MNIKKYKINLTLENAPKEIDPKYYAVLWSIFDLVDNDQNFSQKITSISPIIRENENKFKFFISIIDENYQNKFLEKLIQKQVLNIDKLMFKFQGFEKVKEINFEELEPSWEYSKILINFQSPTCFSWKDKKPYFDIQPLPIFKSINKKLQKLWVELYLDLFEVEKNIKTIWLKNLTTEKVWIKNWFKIWFIWKIFFEVKWEEIFKKKIAYLLELVEFLWVWLNPRLWMWNAYWKILKSHKSST